MKTQIPLDDRDNAEIRHQGPNDGTHKVASDVVFKRLGIVNIVFVGPPGAGDRGWVLVDTGILGTSTMIEHAAEKRFGRGARPAAILLTHGHADHTGNLEHLARKWETPVYVHPLEFPYLNGVASYPPPDPSVGGGLMSLASPLLPRGPVNVSTWLRPLPGDRSVPGMPGWRWIHTPGHSIGHVSFWRQSDKLLLSGDAFITTNQESAYAIATQKPEMHGPPLYFTHDWQAAKESVQSLAALLPHTVVTGHGIAMTGPDMEEALQDLALNFDHIAVPSGGKYVEEPANLESGRVYCEP